MDEVYWSASSDADYLWICAEYEEDLLSGPGDVTVVGRYLRDGTLFESRSRVIAAVLADPAFDLRSVVDRLVAQLDRTIAEPQ
jgi:hypothetical protein